jgi:hypothetical protein
VQIKEDLKKLSSTPTLIRLHLKRAGQLIRAVQRENISFDDAYRAIGMASEELDDADRLFCITHEKEISDRVEPKTFEELTGKHVKLQTKAAGISR